MSNSYDDDYVEQLLRIAESMANTLQHHGHHDEDCVRQYYELERLWSND